MTFPHALVLLSGLLSFAGFFAYIRDTLAGRTKPNRVTWFFWALAPLIGTAAALSADADPWVASRTFLAGFLPLIIFLASFINPQSYWKLTTFDLLCGVCSLLAIVAWIFADVPRFAILLAAAGDGFAAIPTFRKAWKFPETETGITYVIAFVSVLLVFPSIPRWDIENSAFLIFLLLANASLMLAAYRKRLGLGR